MRAHDSLHKRLFQVQVRISVKGGILMDSVSTKASGRVSAEGIKKAFSELI